MRTKLFVLLAFVGLTLASCIKEDAADGGKNNNKGDSWLALKISAPQTRGLNHTDKDPGTIDESKINEVMVIFFNGHSSNSSKLDYYSFAADEYIQSGSIISTKAFMVPQDAEAILVAINPTAAFRERVIYSNLLHEVCNPIAESVNELTGDGMSFMMTNASGMLEPWYNPNGYIEPYSRSIQEFTRDSEMAAENSPFSLFVDRLVAKVRLYSSNSANAASTTRALENNLNIDYDNIQWGLNITNKFYYPISERTFSAFNYGLGSGVSGVWSDRYELGGYRIDPNMIGPDFGGQPYNDNFNHVSRNYISSFQVNFKPLTNFDSDNVEYCLENTFEESSSFNAYTTQAIVKVQLSPASVSFPYVDEISGAQSYTEEPFAFGDSWFRIYSIYYSEDSLREWLKINPNNLVEIFNNFLISVGVGSTINPDNIDSTFGQVMTDLNSLEKGLTNGIVNFYFDSWNYYNIMIKHDDDGDNTNNLFGEFGVVRNSMYDIHINSIRTDQPGSPIIPEPDPYTPNEGEDIVNDQYLSVFIEINPWTWYTQSEEL